MKEWFSERIAEFLPHIQFRIGEGEEIKQKFIGHYQEKKWGFIRNYNVIATGLFVLTNKNLYFYGKVRHRKLQYATYFLPDSGTSLAQLRKIQELHEQVIALPMSNLLAFDQKKNEFKLMMDASYLGPKSKDQTKKIRIGIPRGKEGGQKEPKAENLARADEFRQHLEETLPKTESEA